MDVQPVDTQPAPSAIVAAPYVDQGSAAFVPPPPSAVAVQPVQSAPASGKPGESNGAAAFAQAASQIFGAPAGDDVSVSIRVAQHPSQVIAVFRDAHGNIIQQVPSEVVVRLAEFFDQQLGALLDRNA